MKIIAVIPCHNEEKAIYDLVTRARKYVDYVIVADDNSTDKTIYEAVGAGAIIIQNNLKRGFGGNVMSGIREALLYFHPDVVVTLDGDGQHNPDEIPQVIDAVCKNEADMVIGARFLKEYKAPRYRKVGIDIITWLYNLGYRDKINDGQSCFRAYSQKLLNNIKIEDRGFGFSTEILIKARVKGYRIKEVPVTCIYHKELRMNSSMNPIVQGLAMVCATVKWRWKMKNGGDC